MEKDPMFEALLDEAEKLARKLLEETGATSPVVFVFALASMVLSVATTLGANTSGQGPVAETAREVLHLIFSKTAGNFPETLAILGEAQLNLAMFLIEMLQEELQKRALSLKEIPIGKGTSEGV